MATQAQTDANRRNSQRSTGPRTAAGKAASSKNAARHGFYAEDIAIGEEDEHEFVALQKDYFQTCDPQGRLETALVLELIRSDWLLRRTTTLETQLWNRAIEGRREWLADDFDESVPLAHGYYQVTTDLVLVQRRLTSLSRTWHRALKDLEHLQSARAKTVSPPPAPPEIGFVSKECEAPDPLTEPRAATVQQPSRPPAPDPRPQPPAPPARQIGFVPQKPEALPEPEPTAANVQQPSQHPAPARQIGFVPQKPEALPPAGAHGRKRSRTKPAPEPQVPAPIPCATMNDPTARLKAPSSVESVHTCGPLRSLLAACKIR